MLGQVLGSVLWLLQGVDAIVVDSCYVVCAVLCGLVGIAVLDSDVLWGLLVSAPSEMVLRAPSERGYLPTSVEVAWTVVFC